MERARILIVDDKQNLLGMLARLFGEAYDVTTAVDGPSAISLVASREFDVVLTDVRMPGADGFDVLRAAKAHAPETEVIVMTAYGSPQGAVEALRRGAYDYLQKPFDPDHALVVVERALGGKRLRERAERVREEAAAGPRLR